MTLLVPWRIFSNHKIVLLHKKLFIVEPFFLDYYNILFTIRKKWFFYELFTERFFGEPEMVLLKIWNLRWQKKISQC